MSSAHAVYGLLSLALLGACDLFVGPDLPDAAVRFTPPARYQRWWELTESCAGRSRDFSAVTWYYLPGALQLPEDLGGGQGAWFPVGNRVLLAEDFQLAGDLVRHEMLHAIASDGEHPPSTFQDRCAGIVVCNLKCQLEGGTRPPVTHDAPVIYPAELSLSVAAWPAQTTFARDSGAISLIVTARSRAEVPVQVAVKQEPRSEMGYTFGVLVRKEDGTPVYLEKRHTFDRLHGFLPGIPQRDVFDVRVAPGRYRAYGLFDADSTEPVDFEVRP